MSTTPIREPFFPSDEQIQEHLIRLSACLDAVPLNHDEWAEFADTWREARGVAQELAQLGVRKRAIQEERAEAEGVLQRLQGEHVREMAAALRAIEPEYERLKGDRPAILESFRLAAASAEEAAARLRVQAQEAATLAEAAGRAGDALDGQVRSAEDLAQRLDGLSKEGVRHRERGSVLCEHLAQNVNRAQTLNASLEGARDEAAELRNVCALVRAEAAELKGVVANGQEPAKRLESLIQTAHELTRQIGPMEEKFARLKEQYQETVRPPSASGRAAPSGDPAVWKQSMIGWGVAVAFLASLLSLFVRGCGTPPSSDRAEAVQAAREETQRQLQEVGKALREEGERQARQAVVQEVEARVEKEVARAVKAALEAEPPRRREEPPPGGNRANTEAIIGPDEARRRVGEDVVLKMPVRSYKSLAVRTLLNSLEKFQNDQNFVIVVTDRARMAYELKHGKPFDPAALTEVVVAGRVALFQGRPQIEVDKVEQFRNLLP